MRKALLIASCFPLFSCSARAAFGGSSIDKEVFDWICNNIPKHSTILELGSGHATKELAKHYTMISIENSPKWLNKYESTYIYAPIRNGWYDVEVLKRELPKHKYQAILIDGPLGSIGRFGFYTHLELFNTNVPLIFDDVNRPAEKKLLDSVAEALNRSPITIGEKAAKSAAVILPPK